jgi:hypothetical protein
MGDHAEVKVTTESTIPKLLRYENNADFKYIFNGHLTEKMETLASTLNTVK